MVNTEERDYMREMFNELTNHNNCGDKVNLELVFQNYMREKKNVVFSHKSKYHN